MLAKAPLPSINFSPWRSLSSAQPRLCRRHGCFLFVSSTTSSSSRSGGVLVRAEYTKTPLETKGAYQVVDEETGEKFIVWGGADDPPDSPLPPKDVLFWKPPKSSSAPINAGDDDGNEQVAATGKPTVKGMMGFKKLKVYKLRDLVKKASPGKQDMIEHRDGPVVKGDQSIDSYDKVKFMGSKNKVSYPGSRGNASRESKPSQHKDRIQEFKDDIKGARAARPGGNVSRDSKPPQHKDRIQEFKDNVRGDRTARPGGNVSRDSKPPQHRDRIQEFKDNIKGTRAARPEGSVSRDSKPSQHRDRKQEFKDDIKGTRAARPGGNVSRDSKPPQQKDRIQEFKDKVKGTRAEVDKDEPDVVVNLDTESSENQRNGDEPHKSDSKTNPRVSSARLGGWGGGDGGAEPEGKYRTSDHQKRGRKSSIDSDFFSRKSFRDIGCSEYMIECLKAQSFSRPSNIQAMAFSSVVEGKSCIVADQSGSGKTLAYLAPVIQRLREEELQGVSKSSPQSPRVVVLVPTAELASQVLSNCRSISKNGVPFRSMVVTGGFRQKTQLETLKQEVDVVIATPGRFMYLIKEGHLQLTNIRCAVLDEVDILFNDEDFESSLQNLISSSPFTTQYLFATATLPVNIYNKLVEVFPDCNVIMGPGMHRTSPRLEEVLVDCSGDYGSEKSPDAAFTNKKTALLRIVEERRVSKTIIFCNKIETCRKVENLLKRFDKKETRVKVLPFHAALEQELRLGNMKEFINSQPKDESLFLVCTDRASRGIDFPSVDHVILFDFPRDPSEYVRRVGRTARGASGKGKAFALVVGKQVSLAGRIMERNQKGRPLHDVPAAYELFT